jgi:hypothetical protein
MPSCNKHGKVHEIGLTVYGWKVIALIKMRSKLPLAVKVVKSRAYELLCRRALMV